MSLTCPVTGTRVCTRRPTVAGPGKVAAQPLAGAGLPSQRLCLTASRLQHKRVQHCRPLRGLGKDITEGYLDVAKLLSGSAKVKTSYEKLASMIGVLPVKLLDNMHAQLAACSTATALELH